MSASTHRTYVAVCSCLCVSVSTHTGRPWLSISTHISLLVLGLSTLVLLVDCLGDFGPHGLSVQYTQDVRGCLPAHTGRTCLSVSTHRTYVAVCSCLCVSVSTHTGRLWLSISTHIGTFVLGLSMLALPGDCLDDFGPRVLSVQYTQDVRGCPPAYTGRQWRSVAVRQHTHDVCGCPSVSVCVRQHTQDVCGFWVSVSTHRMSVCVRQHTQDIRGCPCVFVCVRPHTQDVCGCPSVHISAHWSLDSAR